jgi:hypothetical protein
VSLGEVGRFASYRLIVGKDRNENVEELKPGRQWDGNMPYSDQISIQQNLSVSQQFNTCAQ